MALAASLLHEAGHIVVFAVLLHRLPELTVSVTGICLSMRGVILSPGRRLLLAVAGPCANFLCCVLFLICMESWAGYSYAGHWFAAANVLTGGFNLLPLPGLDGAAAVDCLRQLQIGTKCFASEKLHSGQK
ncbi:MAG: peptidase [Gemmiger sp.]